MNTSELFIDGNNLPDPLSKQETYDLLLKIKQGDQSAIEKLAQHNIRLILYEVTGRFNSVNYDKKDLVSIGNIGLMKAITSFDTSKKIEFTTYAVKCIDNEILMFLRKINRWQNVDSLDRTVNQDKDDEKLKLGNSIADETDMVEDLIRNETYPIIRQALLNLPKYDREILMLYFGFNNDVPYGQKEIADMLSISQSSVSRIIRRNIKILGQQLAQKGIVDLKTNGKTIKLEVDKKALENKKIRNRQNIYEYFSLYEKEQVDMALEKLTEEERAIIRKKYKEDLNNTEISTAENKKFYVSIAPKIQRRLIALDKAFLKNNKKNYISMDLVEQTHEIKDAKTITENDYIKLLELLKTPNFIKMAQEYSLKEIMVASLKLGYVNGKYFLTEEISKLLSIEEREVIDITKKVLLSYKRRMDEIIAGDYTKCIRR